MRALTHIPSSSVENVHSTIYVVQKVTEVRKHNDYPITCIPVKWIAAGTNGNRRFVEHVRFARSRTFIAHIGFNVHIPRRHLFLRSFSNTKFCSVKHTKSVNDPYSFPWTRDFNSGSVIYFVCETFGYLAVVLVDVCQCPLIHYFFKTITIS